MQPTPVFLSGESHGQRNLEGCGPWGSQKSWTRLVTKQQNKQKKIGIRHKVEKEVIKDSNI